MASPATTRASFALLLGLGLQFAGYYYLAAALPPRIASGVGLVAASLLVYGCAVIAARKSYSPWLGMLGLLSIPGVAVVLLLPPSYSLPRIWRRSPILEHHPEPDPADEQKPSP